MTRAHALALILVPVPAPVLVLLGVLVLSTACASHAEVVPSSRRPRVLFIGNSLTYSHDVPRMVADLAAAAGAPLEVDAVTFPGASLEDHWSEGSARRRLASERWDVVVLQQGPSALPESRVLLRRDAARFAELARASGARVALYMPWPSRARAFDFDAVHESYALAARDAGALFIPAGDAWRAAWRVDPQLALYSPDGLHPTVAGAYLAALVIHATVAGRSPLGAPAPAGVPAVELLQRAAAEVTSPRK